MRLPLDDVKFRSDLYPRIETDPAIVQRYAEHLEVLPPIEVNQHHELIDGWHRWIAHKKAKAEDIAVKITDTASDVQLLALACERNASHGLQLTERDKQALAERLFNSGAGLDEAAIAKILSIGPRQLSKYLSDAKAGLRRRQRESIFDLWLQCYTDAEIGKQVGLSRSEVQSQTAELPDLESVPKMVKLLGLHEDADWEPPLYDIWNPAKKSNVVKHYGNTPVEFVDNLLYTFTKPFEVVIDPCAGGGSTIDACRKRLRRYWVSDRIPIVERQHEIRKHDLATDGISGPSRWADVALVYLDPPYWKQAEGKYSTDPTDLANMSLDEFTKTLVDIIRGYARKLRAGAHVACITSPTQWPNEDKSVNYHDLDLARLVGKKLKLVRRVVCPYSTEQYNGTQVNIAKEQRLWLVLSRTMLVWERTG